MSESPWEFGTAVEKDRKASLAQSLAEENLKVAYRDWAEAVRLYRSEYAKEIVRQVADGAAWTVAKDLARGSDRVAELEFKMNVQEGVKEAQLQAAWRASADRKSVRGFSEWSERREFAETGVGA